MTMRWMMFAVDVIMILLIGQLLGPLARPLPGNLVTPSPCHLLILFLGCDRQLLVIAPASPVRGCGPHTFSNRKRDSAAQEARDQ
jgi:hypothetical protein